ncbi:RtcB family protein [Pseudonocardia halophobica]|uniref:3'-phosphate/5'-hydroxy nucleic acid ligase n=1 Tax=Pseudonocardia halophobica TaxID=29401 RepID=A0A9W6NXC0_9PSEU|nr:RtcB family protein [Pseudonocardia halophobica]GLL12327.1 RNA-splicing ligase RtcB [Pseudonocardia halophobica]
MQKINDKLYSWASILEPATLAQAERTAAMPFVQPYLALMPDAHLGAGATVGSVIPTVGAIMPAAVGVDIGCGMIAVRTQFIRDDLGGRALGDLRRSVEKRIPLSAGHYNRTVGTTAAPRVAALAEEAGDRLPFYEGLTRVGWELQLGSLGSGNHFIELTADEDGTLWLFLHSGSRGIGNKIAGHHIRVAQDRCREQGVRLPDRDLAHLGEGTPEFDAYVRDLEWAQHFALANREEMMDRFLELLGRFLGAEVEERERINCHHNFTAREHHLGQDVWLSRKGAIRADAGRPGLIPGSMGTASYVVTGKGDPASFASSPHGAGRAYARRAARRTFTLEDMDKAMVGIEYRRDAAFLDEIPAAYKDIDVVMADAADLVEVRHTLRQIVNVKGD